MAPNTTRPPIAPKMIMNRTISVNGEKVFHPTVLGAAFGDDRSVRRRFQFVTVHLYCPNTEHTNMYDRFGGGELDSQPVLVCTVVMRWIEDGSGKPVVGNWNGEFHDEHLDRINFDDVTVTNYSTNKTMHMVIV